MTKHKDLFWNSWRMTQYSSNVYNVAYDLPLINGKQFVSTKNSDYFFTGVYNVCFATYFIILHHTGYAPNGCRHDCRRKPGAV